MNTRTGEIITTKDFDSLSKDWIEVENELITEKQRLEGKVSKHDNKSPLGKMFTGNRRERREQERKWKKNNLKNKNI